MKKITFTILFGFLSFNAFSQVPYTNYWDETSEWRYISGGWDGIRGYTYYTTTYFDGYLVVNGVSYWKEFTNQTKVTTAWDGSPILETIFYDEPILTREDADGNFYRRRMEWDYEVLTFSNQQIINAQLGELFPASGAGCNVESIEINYLGNRPLKRVKGVVTGNNAGTLEGVGTVGNNCSVGYEYNGGINCYKKQNYALQFGTTDCTSPLFPPAIRNGGLGVGHQTITEKISAYPNPNNGIFKISMPSLLKTVNFEIFTINGVKILEDIISSNESIDISSFSSGIYLAKVTVNGTSEYLKIIKN